MELSKLKKNWTAMKEMIRDEYGISTVSYNTWIKNLELGEADGNTVTICIPSENSLMLSYITNKYREPFQAAISEALNENVEVVFVLKNNTAESEEAEETKSASSYINNAESANLNPKYRFDTFVVGSNNRLAHSACLAVAEDPPDALHRPLRPGAEPGEKGALCDE